MKKLCLTLGYGIGVSIFFVEAHLWYLYFGVGFLRAGRPLLGQRYFPQPHSVPSDG